MRRQPIDVSEILATIADTDRRRLVGDLCGETFKDNGSGPFRFLRVCEDGTVERCWMQRVDQPVSSCSLGEAVRIILSQASDHPMVRALIDRIP